MIAAKRDHAVDRGEFRDRVLNSLREILHAQIGRPLRRIFALAGDTRPQRVIAADLLDEVPGPGGERLVAEAAEPIRMHRASAAAASPPADPWRRTGHDRAIRCYSGE
jgi:hypothetical protein